jgi:hypothetical protein
MLVSWYTSLEIREYGRRDPSRWPRGTLYPRKLALTPLTSGGRSVGIVRLRIQATEFSFFSVSVYLYCLQYLVLYSTIVEYALWYQGEHVRNVTAEQGNDLFLRETIFEAHELSSTLFWRSRVMRVIYLLSAQMGQSVRSRIYICLKLLWTV